MTLESLRQVWNRCLWITDWLTVVAVLDRWRASGYSRCWLCLGHCIESRHRWRWNDTFNNPNASPTMKSLSKVNWLETSSLHGVVPLVQDSLLMPMIDVMTICDQLHFSIRTGTVGRRATPQMSVDYFNLALPQWLQQTRNWRRVETLRKLCFIKKD